MSAAEAATRSGGTRSRDPVTQRASGGQRGGGQHGGAASSALMQVPMRYNESCIRLELKALTCVQAVSLQSIRRACCFRNLPTRLSIINEGNSTLPVVLA